MDQGKDDLEKTRTPDDLHESDRETGARLNKDKLKAFVKKKLKPIHQEIIAPPGQ
jgi:hypothetical protein